MFCGQCGKPVLAGNKFCPNCGSGVAAQPAAPAEPAPPASVTAAPLPPPPPQPQPAVAAVAPPPPPPPAPFPMPAVPMAPMAQPVAVAYVAPPRRHGFRNFLIVLGLLAVTAVVIIALVILSRPDPRDAVDHVRQAFANRDVNAFRQVVDEDSVLSNGLDQLADPIAKAIQQSLGTQDNALASIGVAATLDMLKPQLVPELKASTEEIISSGASGAAADSSANNGNGSSGDNQNALVSYFVSSLLHHALNAGATYVSSEVVNRSGNSATVQVKMHLATQADDVPVTLDLNWDQGQWRIVKIENLVQTFETIGGTS